MLVSRDNCDFVRKNTGRKIGAWTICDQSSYVIYYIYYHRILYVISYLYSYIVWSSMFIDIVQYSLLILKNISILNTYNHHISPYIWGAMKEYSMYYDRAFSSLYKYQWISNIYQWILWDKSINILLYTLKKIEGVAMLCWMEWKVTSY